MVEVTLALTPVRDRILEAAERVVSQVGAARLTLDLVAQAAGVSKGGLLYHFPTKESLLGGLAQRYVDHQQQCVDAARCELHEHESGRELKACILGLLGDDPRSKTMGAALLAAAANDPALLEVIRETVERSTQQLVCPQIHFARAVVVLLAVEGLKIREWLRISCLSDQQRAQVVEELLKMAEEAFAGRG
ncbi:MAG: helix-turn-helix domain-containing protein [Steroidobacteraceae bacterium]|nr:helix-turn-helix domain-containing protein [Steroidobacteraceae bacterium]